MRMRTQLASVVLLSLVVAISAGAWQTDAYQSVGASGSTSVSIYNPDGKLISVTDATGNTTSSRRPVASGSGRSPQIARPAGTPQGLSGTIIHVPADQPTIQAAINAANNGDTVLVSDGTYTENINFSGKAITVTSVNGSATTIIDGGAVDTVVTFKTGEGSGSVLSGFTIQNGFSNFNKPNFGDGGGIYIANASPTITNNVINNNKGCEGTGIFSHFGSPLIQGNIISNNSQSGCSGGIGGGGIAVGGSSAPQIIGNVIANNSLLTGANGAGISLFAAGAPVIQNNVISGNSTGSSGGGMALANDSSPQIVNNLFIHNTAAQGGAVYWVIPTSTPGMLLLNNTMAANSSSSGSAIFDGGFDTNMAIQNNLIIGTTGQSAYFCNQLNGNTTPAVFANNDVFTSGASAISGNCTVATGTNGNISSDPLFVDAALDNFRLQLGSPAVNAGNNNARIPLPATDLDGNPRIFNSTVDMGAFEFQTTTTTFSSTSLTFPPTPVGTSSTAQSVTISNTGSIALQIAPFSASGDFSETDNCLSGHGIAAGQSCTITITFTPSAAGIRTGQITVTSNDASGATTIQLSGTGGVPVASLSTNSLSFGNQTLNTSSAPQSVTLTNTGSGPLTINSIAASGDFSQSNNCGSLLAAGGNCAISVTFTPSALGTRTGAITITDNAGDNPQSVSLFGTGTAAIATLSVTSFNFGNQRVGTTSTAQSIMLTNNGNIALTISSIAITGTNSGDFAQTNNCGASLAPATSCSIATSFTPGAIGSRNAAITITDNAADSPQTVSLTGTGTAAVATLSATSLSFGNQPVGATSAAQSITLTNSGNIALTISSITVTGANSGDFAQSNNCGASLAPAASCSITTSFTPGAIGSRSAAITITDNASNSPQTVSLSGTGTAAIATLSVTSLSFGNQPVGATSAAQSVTLTNNGNIALTISSITVTGANSGDFAQTNNCGSSLAPATSCSITTSFTPSAIGLRSAAITISDNAAGSPQSVSLSGTGTAAIATLSATSLSFAKQPLTTVSAAQGVTLTNNGNIALTISSIAITGTNSGDFTQTNNCGASLAPAASCSINVVFAPTASGSRSATLSISDNAAGSPQNVTLAGTGTDFSMSASPSSLTVLRKQHGSSTISIVPISGFNQTVSLSCSGAPADSTCSLSPGSVTLNGTSSSTAQLTISTTKNTPRGTFTLVVSGTFGALSHSTTITLTVN